MTTTTRTAPDVEKEEAVHQQTLRRNLSLPSVNHFGSFDLGGSEAGIMGERSIWDFYFDNNSTTVDRSPTREATTARGTYAKMDETAKARGKRGFGGRASSSQPGDYCAGIIVDHCFGEDVPDMDEEDWADHPYNLHLRRPRRRFGTPTKENAAQQDKKTVSRGGKLPSSSPTMDEMAPSHESSSVSSYKAHYERGGLPANTNYTNNAAAISSPTPTSPTSYSSYFYSPFYKSSRRLEYIILYRPREDIFEDPSHHFDVIWQRECLDTGTRLVRWSGSLEISNPHYSKNEAAGAKAGGPYFFCNNPNDPGAGATGTTTTTANTDASNSRNSPGSLQHRRTHSTLTTNSAEPSLSPTAADTEVGWITCYNISRGLNEMACAASGDPVLMHFCKRFGLWSSRLENMKPGSVPRELDQDSLFHPYGSQAADEELQRRLAQGQAPDGAVLDIGAVLQGMPIFFISDLFVDPGFRGTGLGLMLLDRACRRVADSFGLVVVFLRDYTDERLPTYLGLLGFSFLAPGFLVRRHGHGKSPPPRLEEVCPFLPAHLANSSGGRL